MNKSSAHKFTETLLCAVLTSIGFLLSVKLPFLGMLAIPLSGIPAFVSLVSGGFGYFTLFVITTCLATAAVVKFSAVMLFPLVFMPVLFLASGVRLGMKPINAICVALLSATVFSTGMVVVMDSFVPKKEFIEQREKVLEQTQLVEKQFDAVLTSNPDALESVERAKKLMYFMVDTMIMLFPATFFFIWHFLTIGVVYLGAYWLSKIMGYTLEPLPAFKDWKVDWKLVWIFMLGLLFYYILSNNQQLVGSSAKLIKTIGINCLAITGFIYYIAGISLLFFMFDKYKTNIFAKIILSLLALIFNQIVIWFGVIDIWVDFRTPRSMRWSGSDDSD